ncbi:YceI family protein [Pantoea brenneri]|uniref:YceI family protein n=1 Tax=Pantoea brenneri TaxID=472694 RepID=UPI00289D2A9F|nr:YceI family protein [Pantoea brenneri]
MIRIACLLSLSCFLSASLHAAPVTYLIATDKTAIGLSWRAFGHRFSQAHLEGVTGTVTLNAGQDRDDRVEVYIPVDTLVASNALLTWQLKSDMFFDPQHYPRIRFVSSRVAALGAGEYRIFGILTVKDVSRPVVMLATLEGGQPLTSGSQSLTLHATTAISRTAFRVDRLVGIVDDRVAIALTITAQTKPPL